MLAKPDLNLSLCLWTWAQQLYYFLVINCVMIDHLGSLSVLWNSRNKMSSCALLRVSIWSFLSVHSHNVSIHPPISLDWDVALFLNITFTPLSAIIEQLMLLVSSLFLNNWKRMSTLCLLGRFNLSFKESLVFFSTFPFPSSQCPVQQTVSPAGTPAVSQADLVCISWSEINDIKLK